MNRDLTFSGDRSVGRAALGSNGLLVEVHAPDSPEVLVLYRKRADGTSLRSGRDAARRAFDTAT
jgi:hypothetical protein